MKPFAHVLLFLAVILAVQRLTKNAQAAELPARQLATKTLHSNGHRRLLQDTVVSEYTKWCSTHDSTPSSAAGEAAFAVLPYDIASLIVGVDLCNSAVFNVNGQDVKLPAMITGSVTETALPDGRQITLAMQISGVYALAAVQALAALEADPADTVAYPILGLNYILGSGSGPLVTSGFSTEDLFKTLAIVQSLTYTLIFELHDNSKPGDPITTPYSAVFDTSNSSLTFISEDFANLVVEGPLRRSPVYPNLPVGNPAVFTINQLSLGNTTKFNDVSLNILSPDDGTALETLKKEFANFPPSYLLLGTQLDDNATATPTPTPTGTASPSTTPVPTATPAPTGTSAPGGIAPINGTCDPYGSAPNQCFSASGAASICCPGQCPYPGATPSCTGSATAGPTTTPAPTTTTGPTPTPTASASSAPGPPPSTVCDPGSARPNQCFNANGSAFTCCAGACGASGPDPVCAT